MVQTCILLIFLLPVANWAEETQKYEGDPCVDSYTSTIGRCVLVEKCKSAREDLKNNGIRPTFCAFTFDSALVCCRDGSSILKTTPIVNPKTNTNDGSRVSVRKCKEYSQLVTETVSFFAPVPEPEVLTVSGSRCEYTNVVLVVGGQTARVGEFPHMAALGWASGDTYDFKCGGSLISPRFVLTAGHCTYAPGRGQSPQPVIVRLGDHNLDPAVKDGANPIEVPIKAFHKHPEYHPPRRYNDIALLELATDVDLSTRIRPACLWPEDSLGGYNRALATGWGVVKPRTRDLATDLQKVSLSILHNEICNESLTNLLSNKWSGMAETQLCAGELVGGKDTCLGDSGGPIQIMDENNRCIFYIVGITSFGPQAALGWASGDTYDFKCGGSLISPRFVLTAGHCTYAPGRGQSPQPVIVRLGDHNLDPAVKDGANPIEVPIKAFHKHPEYHPPRRYNDIALLELATDVDLSTRIRPACLWPEDSLGGYNRALATGWGVVKPRTRDLATDLQKVSLSILHNEICNESLTNLLSNKWSGMAETQLCAGELVGGKDTCLGDSGGPIQIMDENNRCIFYIVGITSFGPQVCGLQPAVYTRVSSYVSWIEGVVWPGE